MNQLNRAALCGAAIVLLLPSVGDAQGAKPTKEESLLFGDIPTVFGASRFDQSETEAPASISVITADEIAAYGWLTLADLLRTVRGFYVTNDRAYSYVGTRGFSRPGDYNSRILLLVDGIGVNENVFGGGYVGMESMVDLATVERVEIIRGPASSLYGANAFFGIINVITQRGRARHGFQVSGETGSFGARQGAITGGGRTHSGLELFVNASRRDDRGQDLYFKEFNSSLTNHGIASNRDREERDHFFGKMQWGPLTLEGTVNLRVKVDPTASYGTDFNEGRLAFRDQSRNLTLRYEQLNGEQSGLSASISLNRYDYDGMYPYAVSPQYDWAHGRWGVGDVQYTRLVGGRNRFVVGGSYTANRRQEQGVVDVPGQPPAFFDNTTESTHGLFALGESRIGDRIILNGGLRYDHAASIGENWSPRGALIYKLGEGSALKALYGNAFRAPNNFERFYRDDHTQDGNPALLPERVTTYELLIEQVVSRHLKLTASAYRYQARRLIDIGTNQTDGNLQYVNSGRAAGQGIETEAELELGRVTGKASYALQRAWSPGTDSSLSNSPQHLGALNLSVPVIDERLRAGLELRGMSSRSTVRGDLTRGYAVANFVLSSRHVGHVDASAGVFNLFDRLYSDPVGEEHVQPAIQQDGRSFRLRLTYAF